MPDTWTPDRVQILMDMHGNYMTSHICRVLGVTRGAMLGKAFRLGLTKAENSPIKRQNGTPQHVKAPLSIEDYKHKEEKLQGEYRDTMKNAEGCRYIEMEDIRLRPADMPIAHVYCGKHIYRRDLCEEHYHKCWQKVEKKRGPAS